MAVVDLVGVSIIKNHQTLTRGAGGGRPAPTAMEVERRGVGGQFQQKLFVVQYTIDCEKEKLSHFEDWQQFPKNENFTKIDQNAKKHEKRQNDVIFTVWDVQKISCSKVLSFDF